MLETDWIRLVLCVFTVYRLSFLVSAEEGPSGVFERLREWLGAYELGENGLADTNLGRGIACPLCVGVYVSILVSVLFWWPSTLSSLILTVFGIAGGQMFLERISPD